MIRLPFTMPPRATIGAILLAFVAVLLLVQTVRIEGFKIWPFHVRGYKGQLEDIENRIARDKAAQAERERQADATLNGEVTRDAAASAERKKEIDDATNGIPDQATSARQRARACVELRRQDKANGRPQRAC